jgi:hypothetical protein
MDAGTKELIEHGVLGAVIVLQSGLIYYLLQKLFERTNATNRRLDKLESTRYTDKDSPDK